MGRTKGTRGSFLTSFFLALGLSLAPGVGAVDEAPTPEQQSLSPEALELHRQEVNATLKLSATIGGRAVQPASADRHDPEPPGEDAPAEVKP